MSGFKGKKRDGSVATADAEEMPATNGHNGGDNFGAIRRASGLPSEAATGPVLVTPPGTANGTPPTPNNNHNRTTSFGAASMYSQSGLSPGGQGAPPGTAYFHVVSATGYPPKANLLVQLSRQSSRGPKTVHKTKHLKSSSGTVTFDEEFSVPCTADALFTLHVMDHAFFGNDDKLGELPIVVDESGRFEEKNLKVGNGSVVIKSRFEEGGVESPGRASVAEKGGRKSFLGKRETGRGSRDVTPTPN